MPHHTFLIRFSTLNPSSFLATCICSSLSDSMALIITETAPNLKRENDQNGYSNLYSSNNSRFDHFIYGKNLFGIFTSKRHLKSPFNGVSITLTLRFSSIMTSNGNLANPALQ